jgi:hypothetical protein
MARKLALSVDDLEGRSLLSGIMYSLTTDQSTYQVGQPIQMTFTETNTGDQPVTVAVSPTDFSVTVNGLSIWESNPENDGAQPTPVTLQPGQSITQTASWDGTVPTPDAQQGTITTVDVNRFGTFGVLNPNAPSGDTATFQITNPLQGSLTTDQSTYLSGQSVVLTYAETNTSDQTVKVETVNPVLYQILHNGLPVLPVTDPIGSPIQTITPGQTITNQYTYSPPGACLDDLENLTGAFVAEVYAVPADPGEFTADFQITPGPVGAIVSTVSTDQSTYQSGQTVTMTFTETNVSDQPVVIPTGQTGFVLKQTSVPHNFDLGGLPGPVFQAWSTLQPGQSWTQTQTWRVGNLVGGPYTFQVLNAFDLNDNLATFQLLGMSSSTTTSTTQNGGGDSTSSGKGSPVTNIVVTTNHADYQVGASVPIHLRIVGSATAASTPIRSREHITILDGTKVVSRMTRRIPASALKRLRAGKTVRLTTIWDGQPNQTGIRAIKPGEYTVDVSYGGFEASAEIALTRKGS